VGVEEIDDYLAGVAEHFPADQPLPDDLVRALVEAKLRRLGPS
jgi:hypothetical protein